MRWRLTHFNHVVNIRLCPVQAPAVCLQLMSVLLSTRVASFHLDVGAGAAKAPIREGMNLSIMIEEAPASTSQPKLSRTPSRMVGSAYLFKSRAVMMSHPRPGHLATRKVPLEVHSWHASQKGVGVVSAATLVRATIAARILAFCIMLVKGHT